MPALRPALALTGHAKRVRKSYPFFPQLAGTAPVSVAADALTPGFVPANLRTVSSPDPAQDGSLKWDAVPSVSPLGTLVRYELLAYQRIVGTMPPSATTVQVTDAQDAADPQLTVRAVYSMTMNGTAMETPSVASNCVKRVVQYPSPAPSYIINPLVLAPQHLTITPQWNQGAAMNLVEWYADTTLQHFRLDRDGVTVAEGLFTLEYNDFDVAPGSSHTYIVYGMDAAFPAPIYSPPSAPATGVALSGPPSFSSSFSPQNVTVYNYDGNSIVEFDAPYGFIDARIYKVTAPDLVKYAGPNPPNVTSAGINLGPIQRRNRVAIGVDVPPGGAEYHLEFVDKLGPYQLMDMSAAEESGMPVMPTATNGQGSPVNVPAAVGPAVSLTLTGTPDPGCISEIAGAGVFTSFHTSEAFVPMTTLTPEMYAVSQSPAVTVGPADFAVYTTSDLTAIQYLMNTADSKFFNMNSHFMAVGVEGGGPTSNDPPHIQNGGNYFQMNNTFTLAPGQALRMFFLVDNVRDNRRWIDLFLKEAADPFLNSGKFFEDNIPPTASGNLVRSQFNISSHKTEVFYPPNTTNPSLPSIAPSSSGVSAYRYNSLVSIDSVMSLADWGNDIPMEIEIVLQYQAGGGIRCRQRSRTRYTHDLTLQGGGANIGGYDEVFESSSNTFIWPWSPSALLQVAATHELYHLALNGRGEVQGNEPYKRYLVNRRPYLAESHWHGGGHDITPAWPA